MFTSMAWGANVTLAPTQVPKGAYVLGGDGDQFFVQQMTIALANDWAGHAAITITLPADIRVADLDNDGNYIEDVVITWNLAAQDYTEVGLFDATAGSITLDPTVLPTGSTNSETVTITIPVTTSASPGVSSADYTIDFPAGEEPIDQVTVTVYYRDNLSVVLFDSTTALRFNDPTDGKVETHIKGDIHPLIANEGNIVYALPDYIADYAAAPAQGQESASDWESNTLDATNTNDVTFYLWASQIADLDKMDTQTGHRVLDYDDVTVPTPDPKAYTEQNETGTLFDATATYPGLISAKLLEEGDWYLYVTSSLSNDWVLGRSDTLEVRHYPTFAGNDGTNLGDGNGSAVDYNVNSLFEPAGADNVTAMILDSGEILDKDGAFGPASAYDNAKIFWDIEDLDDNAEIFVFISTADLTTTDILTTIIDDSIAVTGMTNAIQINTTPVMEESAVKNVTINVYTGPGDFIAAGGYKVYLVGNDGKHQVLEKVKDVAPADLTLTVAHHPSLTFHDVHRTDPINFDTADDQYLMISWGETIDGDKDPDAQGTAVINLYVSPDNWVTAIDAAGPAAGDPTDFTTFNAATKTLIASIVDSSDTQEANRFVWNLRDADLTAAGGPYYIYGTISHGSNELVVQYNQHGGAGLGGADDDTRSIVLANSSYLRPFAPSGGVALDVDFGDQVDFRWEAFNKEPSGTEYVQIFMVKSDFTPPSPLTYAAIVAGDEYLWLYPNGDGSAQATAGGASAASAEVTVDFSIITDNLGGALAAADYVEYDVWYFYTEDGDIAGAEEAYKSDGKIYLTGVTEALTDVRLTPNLAHLTLGDTITVQVLAQDATPNPTQMNIFLDLPSSYFTILDQDTAAGNQPFLGGAATPYIFDGDVLLNSLNTSDGTYQLNYIERIPNNGSEDIPASSLVAEFQLAVTGQAADVYDQAWGSFSSTYPRETALLNSDGASQALTIPKEAIEFRLTNGGSAKGYVEVEGRTYAGQQLTFYVSLSGSMDPLNNATMASLNGDEDPTDGLQITLGADGAYSIQGIPTGEYDISARISGYLDAVLENVRVYPLSEAEVNFTGASKMFGGDAAGYDDDGDPITLSLPDNEIDGDDTDAIGDAFGATPDSAAWNPSADIDGDSTVFIADLALAARNQGKFGDGIAYKVLPFSGDNDNAVVRLIADEPTGGEVTYTIAAMELASLGAFAAELEIASTDWEVVGFDDGLATLARTYALDKYKGYDLTFASALLGRSGVVVESLNLMTFTLKAKVREPAEPIISAVTLVDGNGEVAKAILSSSAVPAEFILSHNYPNPFNPTTTINFSLPVEGQVKLTIYNLLGQEVRTLVSSAMEPGTYKSIWNSRDNFGRRVTSGIYFYRLVVDNKVITTHKMVLLK